MRNLPKAFRRNEVPYWSNFYCVRGGVIVILSIKYNNDIKIA